MRIIKDTTDFYLSGETVVAIGKFDGFHKGHERILAKMQEVGKRGLKLAVFTFNIPPATVLHKGYPGDHRVLTTVLEKRRIFEDLSIDYLVEFPFYEKTAAILPRDFVEDILLHRMKAKVIVCGPDVRFGSKGAGDISLLMQYASEGAFEIQVVEKEYYAGEPISSSRIRTEILSGHMEEANRMLSKPYMFFGEVMHGRKLGRTMGMPTINLLPRPDKLLPGSGVYFSRVRHHDREYCGVTNIGVRPTVERNTSGEKPPVSVETYLYDFNSEIYGDDCMVFLYHFVRPEMDFGSVEALREQLQADIAAGQKWHSEHFPAADQRG
ncbi:MAG: bifunctional riboflavin kinase/FAD synthetase [Lachnospiraceae bacterium]|nr:bifunctional riboflavin kinase/FAD synthetase [Lachnospiraceae bacterium]